MLGTDSPYPDKSKFAFEKAVWKGVKIPVQYNDPRQDPLPGWIPCILFPLGGITIISSLIVAAASPIVGLCAFLAGVAQIVVASRLADREEKAREHPQMSAIRALFREYCDFCDLGDQPKAQEAFCRARELAWVPWSEHQKALGLQYEITGPLATTDAAAILDAHEELDRRVLPTIEQ